MSCLLSQDMAHPLLITGECPNPGLAKTYNPSEGSPPVVRTLTLQIAEFSVRLAVISNMRTKISRKPQL